MNKQDESQDLPRCAREYIDLVIKKMRSHKKVRREVRAELIHHFIDGLAGCETEEDGRCYARQLMVEFGDAAMLGKLLRRGKNRCRPLWQKVLLRSLYTLCAFVLLVILYSTWFLMGRPTLSVDYLIRLNEMTKPVGVIGENGWPSYEKAIKLYVKPEEVDKSRDAAAVEDARQTGEESLGRLIGWTVGDSKYVPFGKLEHDKQAAISEWIDRNEEAWAQYEQGSTKAYCYREYTMGDEEGHPVLLSVLLPHLSEIRDLARLGIWRSEKQMHANRPQEAVDTCLSVMRSGLHWHHHKYMLIEQLVGQAIVRLAHKQLIDVIARGDLSSDEITRVRQELAEIFKDGFPHMTARYEQLIFEDMVQHVFTDGGPGGGHIIPKLLLQLGGGDPELEDVGMVIVHAGRNKTLAVGNKLYDHMEKTVKMSPWEKRAGNIESAEDFLTAYSKQRYAFIWWMTPAIDRISEIRYRGKALYDAVLTILALKQWELDKGQLPESLEQLKAEGYLKELPDDPYGEGLLTYVRRNGDFVLYSLADDFDDDAGKQNPEDAWARREDGGDRVFWPVE